MPFMDRRKVILEQNDIFSFVQVRLLFICSFHTSEMITTLMMPGQKKKAPAFDHQDIQMELLYLLSFAEDTWCQSHPWHYL